MTVAELREGLSLELLAGGDCLDAGIEGCYIGDLLSWVMANGVEDGVWITVMGNVNAIAVAKLVGVSCILLCENAHLDDDAKAQADANGVPVLQSGLPAYTLAVKIAGYLGELA